MFKYIQKYLIVALVFAMVPLLSGCKNSSPQVITPRGEVIAVELAVTPQEQEQGLMFRKSMAENSGMLFIFGQMQQMTFWMKNTLIPLDVLFIDDKNVIVDIQTMTSCPLETQTCPTYPAKAPAKYALEINAGEAGKLGLKVGDPLTFKLPNNDQGKAK